MQPVPTDLILHALAENLIGMEGNDESLRSLGHTILRTCIDLRALPAQWCNGAGVGQQMSWLTRRLEGGDCAPNAIFVTTGPNGTLIPTGQHVAAETRAMEVAISRRLADTALSLLVTQDDGDKTAALTLLEAAHRVVGLPGAEVHAEDTASWESRVLALEGQLQSLRESRDAIAAENDAWRDWSVNLGGMQDRPNAHDATLRDAVSKRLFATDAKAMSDLRQKVATLERDHAALGKVEGNTSMRAYDLARKIDAITDQWETWARNLLGVDDGTAQELQALIGKVVKRAEASSRQSLAHLDAHKDILAALKLDPGASHSDIIETIKSLQADRATLAERVMNARVPADAPRFKVGDRVIVSSQHKRGRYATVIDNDDCMYAVKFDYSGDAGSCDAIVAEYNLRPLPKVDP